MEEKSYGLLFTLTELTGKKSKDERTMIVQGFELPRRYGLIFFVSFIPALFAGMGVWPMIGSTGAVIVSISVVAIAFLSIESRSRKGMKLKMYQTVFDKGRSHLRKLNGHVIRCGQVVDELDSMPGYIRLSSVDSRRIGEPSASDQRAEEAERDIFIDDFEPIEDIAARHIDNDPKPEFTRVRNHRHADEYMNSETLVYDE